MIQKLYLMKLYIIWMLYQQMWQILYQTNAPTNVNGKKVWYKIDCYILHKALLVIIFLYW